MAHANGVARSIIDAMQHGPDQQPKSLLSRLPAILYALVRVYHLQLSRCRADLFEHLQSKWQLPRAEYESSFSSTKDLQRKGDMGFSGSTFFTTSDGNYIVKSVPRRFEHTFFRNDFLDPYASYMLQDLNSLLIRITHFLASDYISLGATLGCAPTHHIVMENLLAGQDAARNAGGGDWATWDLKPTTYFFPERDFAGGRLTSAQTKAKLNDVFEDKIMLDQKHANSFFDQLERDTQLLEGTNAVDYSLFLVRIPLSQPQNPFADPAGTDNAPEPFNHPPSAPPDPPNWRSGIRSADGRYVFRAAILDFFWAKHKTQAKLMTGLIRAWNLIDKQGPMSITTTPQEYRKRFLDMCAAMIEVKRNLPTGEASTIKDQVV